MFIFPSFFTLRLMISLEPEEGQGKRGGFLQCFGTRSTQQPSEVSEEPGRTKKMLDGGWERQNQSKGSQGKIIHSIYPLAV